MITIDAQGRPKLVGRRPPSARAPKPAPKPIVVEGMSPSDQVRFPDLAHLLVQRRSKLWHRHVATIVDLILSAEFQNAKLSHLKSRVRSAQWLDEIAATIEKVLDDHELTPPDIVGGCLTTQEAEGFRMLVFSLFTDHAVSATVLALAFGKDRMQIKFHLARYREIASRRALECNTSRGA